MKKGAFQDCFFDRSDDRLILGNSRIRRTLDLSSGMPKTISLQDASGAEYAASDKAEEDLSFMGLNGCGKEGIRWEIAECSAEARENPEFDAPHLEVTLRMREPVQDLEMTRCFALYPGLPVMAVWNTIRSAVTPRVFWNPRSQESDWNRAEERKESRVDSLRLAPGFSAVESVEFRGRTDEHDDLVFRHPVSGKYANGNLLFAASADGRCVFYLQEAPPTQERRDMELHDFRLDGSTIHSLCWGIHPSELRPERTFRSNRNVLGICRMEEREKVLRNYLRLRFPLDGAQHTVTVNPWGCGQFPKLVSESFLMEEFRAAAECGATHYQIDDSWQEGGSLLEMIVKNRHITPSFWDVSKDRLNGTFAPLTAAAGEAGIEPSLWVAPSSNAEYRDWREFLDILLRLHRENGFNIFKIDGMQLRSSEAEENLEHLLREARLRSNGRISFNLDATAGQRSGYFRMLEYGTIFLENRYVCHMWGLGYHPEKTLRSLWKLAHWMRIEMLQIEIPYYGDINPEFYRDKPFGSPDAYPWQYWIAIALFANPLLWFAPSRTRPEDRGVLRAMMELHRRIRETLFSGDIAPVGAEPDGHAVTGFHSDAGFLLLFRERQAPARAEFKFPGSWQLLAGSGSFDGAVASLPEPASFALFQKV